MKPQFNNQYTTLQRSVINRLAEIEQSDAYACTNCGGEDCVCCEIYHDRQKWKSPEELFADDDLFGMAEYLNCDGCGGEYRADRARWCEDHNICRDCCEDSGLCAECEGC